MFWLKIILKNLWKIFEEFCLRLMYVVWDFERVVCIYWIDLLFGFFLFFWCLKCDSNLCICFECFYVECVFFCVGEFISCLEICEICIGEGNWYGGGLWSEIRLVVC